MAACLLTAISSPPARAATVVVTLSSNNLFSPKDVTINAGDSITFTNRAGFHNAVCQDPDPKCGFKNAQSAPWGATTTFNTAGLFRYRCTVHSGNFTSGMVGSVTVKAAVNVAPTVTLTNPPPSTVFTAPADIALGASASDSDGSVSQVEFFQNGVPLGVDLTAPYAATATALGPGSFTFSAVATDNAGAKATNAIAVTVNQPAGPITLTNPAVVNGEFNVTVNGTLVGTSYELQGSTSLMDGFTGPAAATFDGAATPIPLVIPGSVSGAPKYYRVRAK